MERVTEPKSAHLKKPNRDFRAIISFYNLFFKDDNKKGKKKGGGKEGRKIY